MIIKIDSRERLPYSFQGATETGTLPVGDYSLSGYESHIAIERKTLDDLIHCLSRDRKRFEAELDRSEQMPYFCLIVEGRFADLARGKYRSKMAPKAVIQSLLAFSVRYRLPIWFCENRGYAQRTTESLLCKFAMEIEETEDRLIKLMGEEVKKDERKNELSESSARGMSLEPGAARRDGRAIESHDLRTGTG